MRICCKKNTFFLHRKSEFFFEQIRMLKTVFWAILWALQLLAPEQLRLKKSRSLENQNFRQNRRRAAFGHKCLTCVFGGCWVDRRAALSSHECFPTPLSGAKRCADRQPLDFVVRIAMCFFVAQAAVPNQTPGCWRKLAICGNFWESIISEISLLQNLKLF